MKILIILAHPELKSFNTAMYQTAIESLKKEGHEVQSTDLYRMCFNPVSDRYNFVSVKNPDFLKLQTEEIYASEQKAFVPELSYEQEKLEWCDLMIWQFPLWWFSMPAILKGWVDRVIAMGRFYGDGRILEKGVLKGKKAIVSITTGSPSENYLKKSTFGDINKMLTPIHRGIFEFLGFSVLKPQINYAVAHITEAERTVQLESWSKRLKTIFNEDAIEIEKE